MDALKALHDKIKGDYPQVNERRRWEGAIHMQEASMQIGSKAMGVDGYVFRSADGKQVVQFRLDGFTFSRLPPHQNWEALRDEANRLWHIFSQGVKIASVQRIAARYINGIDVAAGTHFPST